MVTIWRHQGPAPSSATTATISWRAIPLPPAASITLNHCSQFRPVLERTASSPIMSFADADGLPGRRKVVTGMSVLYGVRQIPAIAMVGGGTVRNGQQVPRGRRSGNRDARRGGFGRDRL